MSSPLHPGISVSIVSHGQMTMVANLLKDLDRWCSSSIVEVILTLNIVEPHVFNSEGFNFVVRVIQNKIPKGFAANHNYAASRAQGDMLCIMNPDLRIQEDVFTPLTEVINLYPQVGLVAPRVIDDQGKVEDSARYFPHPLEVLGKAMGGGSRRFESSCEAVIFPEWVAGMLLLIRLPLFQKMNGLDERYYLYYEDVDFCARLALAGYQVAYVNATQVMHDAQRTSHRNLRYMRWHLSSMIRFFLSKVYRRVRKQRLI
ncbi:MAG: glycosyltransferase family 2 protein [Pseudomonadales bacterium]|nr:glycosyltransferase family 2 protein [Pseudomonadales bacterium]